MKPPGDRLTEQQRAALQKWVVERVRPRGAGREDKRPPQRIFGRMTGVSQGQISKIVIGENTTLSTARMMIGNLGDDADRVLGGTPRAKGRYRGRDKIPMRGDVLEAVSSGYDEEFLEFVLTMSPPAGSDRWTFHQWMRHVVNVRDMYESGVLGPKNGPDSSIKRTGKH